MIIVFKKRSRSMQLIGGGGMLGMLCDIRCENCNRLLCKGCVDWLEIKCPRCGKMHICPKKSQSSTGGASLPYQEQVKNSINE